MASLCLHALSFKWMSCGAFEAGVSAFACEDRAGLSSEDLYARAAISPKIESVSPGRALPGTVLTISGEWPMSASSPRGLGAINVTLGPEACQVTRANASSIECLVPMLDSGVVPVRVTSEMGNFGPAGLPLVTIEHRVKSLSPKSGSLGGGQARTNLLIARGLAIKGGEMGA